MKATEQLIEEHKAIKLGLSILGSIGKRIEAGEEVDKADIGSLLEFFKIFTDKCHHGKEEDILFGAMESIGLLRESGPIALMLKEHKTGRSYLVNMNEAFERYRSNGSTDFAPFVKDAKKYVLLLTQHIDKENRILYPMIEAHLSEKGRHKLTEQFKSLEEESIGLSRHEELYKLINHLKDKYLEP